MASNRVRNITVLAVLAVLGLALASWFLLLSPRLAEADEIAAQVEQVEASNLALRNRVNQTRDLAADAPRAAAEAQAIFEKMPRQADLPTVLRQITDAAGAAGIRPVDVQLISTSVPVPASAGPKGAKPPTGVALANMDISISVLGERPELLDFVDNLQALDRAVLITGTQVSGGTEPDMPNALQVQGTMFVLQSELPDLVAQMEQLLAESQAESPDAPAPDAADPS
jgi:type IV pilus assembly protein PilO